MRITKHGHACVRIEHGSAVVVLDPGVFSDPDSVDGATAILITHEHPDHYSADHLRRSDAPVFTVDGVAAQLRDDAPDVAERTTVVAPGESFDPGIPARAVGELHAVIHPELPRIHNSGFVLTGDESVYHPGDALTLPGQDVDVLLLPVSAPWLRVGECIDFAREVGAARNLAVHDRVYSETGLGIVDGHLQRFLEPLGLAYRRIADGESLEAGA